MSQPLPVCQDTTRISSTLNSCRGRCNATNFRVVPLADLVAVTQRDRRSRQRDFRTGGCPVRWIAFTTSTPSLDSPAPVLTQSGVTSELSSVLEARLWGWKLSLSVDRTDQKLARRD